MFCPPLPRAHRRTAVSPRGKICIAENLAGLYRCYTRFSALYSGIIARSYADFAFKMRDYCSDSAECAAAYRGDELVGYCIYFSDDSRLDGIEFVADSSDTYAALYALLAELAGDRGAQAGARARHRISDLRRVCNNGAANRRGRGPMWDRYCVRPDKTVSRSRCGTTLSPQIPVFMIYAATIHPPHRRFYSIPGGLRSLFSVTRPLPSLPRAVMRRFMTETRLRNWTLCCRNTPVIASRNTDGRFTAL